jgi:hypothetical protein
LRRYPRFLLTSPNAYNTLGVGTTQLYDKTVVYNHKRHGHFMLAPSLRWQRLVLGNSVGVVKARNLQ